MNHKTWDKAIMLPMNKLRPTPWNANEMSDEDFAVLVDEVSDSSKYDEPIQIVEIVDGDYKGDYWILSGEHRYKACLANGYKEIPCVIREDLDPHNKEELMIWSVKRNNIRGKLNEAKYMKIQSAITGKFNISKEAAQKRMMTREIMAEKLAESRKDKLVLQDTKLSDEILDETDDKKDKKKSKELPYETDGEKDRMDELRDRKNLFGGLKEMQTDVLLESGDTVEHGYLYFTRYGKKHLLVEEDATLHNLIGKMVSACKENSHPVHEFLILAIKRELDNWK